MKMDPEIQAMSTVAEALSPLDDETRTRVLRWALDRYAPSAGINTSRESVQEGPDDVPDITKFSHISELFNAAGASTQSEKVLVASYWFQVIEGQSEIDARTVNGALKQLGHRVGNITSAFTSLQSRKPALAMQVRKKGSTQQAKKKYKLTTAGIQEVERMVLGTGD